MTTKDDCLDALQRAADELGEPPSKAQYEALGFTPSASTILRHCGGWNAAKAEAGLETNTSTGSRTLSMPDDVELPEGMVWEELSQDQRWHYRNRAWNTQRSLDRRQKLREWLREVKRNRGGCRECGESDPQCLDFHHRNAAEKDLDVNKTVPFGWSRDRIRAEVDKCDLLCANCHTLEHSDRHTWTERIPNDLLGDGVELSRSDRRKLLQPGAFGLEKADRLRLWTYAYQREVGCRECDLPDPVRLQFHHTDDDKTATVADLIGASASTNDVLREVKKCEVLCVNCHRKEHSSSLES
ncbi:homing endonuclease associated repeat-containing protein [Halobaculum roseum]|uniref:Homing endonuclease associated repeat-containing protein n=1 Tax=Halobaculum roseum TaxID=2175149 RepID=A0ABD5MKQ7_9EURY|nr:hypothetical protein [Halobaculum roseum]QZY01422.1 hypothetical protein K6T36_08655 [Halobaculum roseum]